MDSQRSLFKKFFGNDKHQADHGDNPENRGFNPPKFQFDKKKLGIMNNSRTATEPAEPTKYTGPTTSYSEPPTNYSEPIDTIGIDDSELGDHMDDWMDTTVDNSVNTTMDTDTAAAMNTAINNTMNTTKIVEIPKEATTTPIHNTHTDTYNGILQKNHQKYNLSNQLEHFNEYIEVFQRNCGDKRNKMELLVLSLDEKVGKLKCSCFKSHGL